MTKVCVTKGGMVSESTKNGLMVIILTSFYTIDGFFKKPSILSLNSNIRLIPTKLPLALVCCA